MDKALAAKMKLSSDFKSKGIKIALLSGLLYGLYCAFLYVGMSKGAWATWYDKEFGLSGFVTTYFLAALGAAINDLSSAGWALGSGTLRGKVGDFFKCIKTKPGMVMAAAAVIGGPIASTAFVIGLTKAGPIAGPISALCPAVGAILGRIWFKQELSPRMILGIAICVSASFLIGTVNLTGEVPEGMVIGILFAFIAALAWGFEGCVCGYGTSMIDSEIGITIRQVTSGLTNIIILIPILGYMSGTIDTVDFVSKAFTDSSMIFFAISGLCAYLSFMFWYKGNSMCGAALGMSCNGTFSFWVPFCYWLVVVVIFQMDTLTLKPIEWFGAIIMVVGIFIIAINPLEYLKKSRKKLKPLNYSILKHFTTVGEASVDDVMNFLGEDYFEYSAFNKESVISAILTAEANGLLEETKFDMDSNNELRVYYRASEEGADTINQYIKD